MADVLKTHPYRKKRKQNGLTNMQNDAIKVRLDADSKRTLEALAAARGEGLSVVVREAIRIYVATTDVNIPPALREAAKNAVSRALVHGKSKSKSK